MTNETANHALQRTAPCVTAPASTAAFPPTMQVPRRTPRSLSLGSLGGIRTYVMSERDTLADSTATGRAGDLAGPAVGAASERSGSDLGRLLPRLLCGRSGESLLLGRIFEPRCGYAPPLRRHARSARLGPSSSSPGSGAAPSMRCSQPLRASQSMLPTTFAPQPPSPAHGLRRPPRWLSFVR